MLVTVNGIEHSLKPNTTLEDLVLMLLESDIYSTDSLRGFAIAVDMNVVPRSKWKSFELPQGAIVEIVTAAAGG